jgi:HK97 gp10 family phage protein
MIGIEITGIDDLAKGLKAIGKKMRTEIASEAVTTALVPMVNEARALAGKSRDTGALQESIGVKVKPYKRGAVIFGIVGPRRGFKKPDPSGKGFRDPVKYAHLVEYGHHTKAASGKFGGAKKREKITAETATAYVLPQPFMRPAFAKTKGQMVKTLGEVIGGRVDVEAKRVFAARRGRRAAKKSVSQ